jgi:uncharacterized protein (TIGR02594 family)
MIGKTEADAAIKDYLATGGVNLDPTTTAWCAAAVNSALAQSGQKGTGSNMARDFLKWGGGVDQPQKGDLAVFSRGDPNGPYGHVGFFDGYNQDGSIRVLGGNQSDGVSVASYGKDRLLGFRRGASIGQSGQPQTNQLAPQQSQPQPQQNPLAQMPWQDMRQDASAFMNRNRLG